MAETEVLRRMTIVEGDITRLEVAAIVNAANETLLGGGGVDGAIHAAAGPALLEECRGLGGCPTGEARITRGYALAPRHVIHTVGPIWQGGGEGEEALLGGCYRGSLTLARDHDLEAIAFPAISTGVYRFPPARAAEIAVATVAQFLTDDRIPEKVIFCCFGEASADAHRAALSGIG